MNMVIKYDDQECWISAQDEEYGFVDKNTSMEDVAQTIYDLVALVMPYGTTVRLEEV